MMEMYRILKMFLQHKGVDVKEAHSRKTVRIAIASLRHVVTVGIY